MHLNPLRFCISILALLLVCLQQHVFAQDAPDYTKVYHPVINQAELHIVTSDYKEALQAYEQAFASVPSPFARDYYNAAVSALALRDRKQTFNYLEKLVQKGVSLDYLQRQTVFDSLQTTRHWRKFARKYKKRRRKYEENFNREYRADLDELYARDQYFRQAEGGLRVYRDTIRQIENANTLQLLNWIEERGYPNENIIGLADTLEQLPRFYITVQRQTATRKGYDFTEVLLKAVQQGNIAPQPVAYLLDQQAGRNRYGSSVYMRVDCTGCKDTDELATKDYLVKKITPKEQERINARRQKLGLEPLEEYKRKVLHNVTDPRFKLGYNWSVSTYVVPSKEAAEILLERLSAIE
ncbi:hypothetical protein [Pontibacter akesuensis]|nr:hypothetical protein [Pontibacter akesuensis]GHA67550.1 hypothetical protein GCM10007389_20960 [Pontibacter akesuensis]